MKYLILSLIIILPLLLFAQEQFLSFEFTNLTGSTSTAVTPIAPTSGNGILTAAVSILLYPYEDGSTGKCLRTRHDAATVHDNYDGIQVMGSTAGYDNIELSWLQRHTNNSANRVLLRYTIDGVEWLDFNVNEDNASNYHIGQDFYDGFDDGLFKATIFWNGSGVNIESTYYQRSVNLSAIAGVNNNPNFGIQLLRAYPSGENAYVAVDPSSSYSATSQVFYDTITFSGELLPIVVDNIAELRSITQITTQRYKLAGYITVSMANGNRIYAQDSSNAGICIVDTDQVITTTYSVGDVLTNIIGVLEEVDDMLVFIPRSEPELVDTEAPITPINLSLESLVTDASDYQSRLVKVSDVFFQSQGTFENDTVYQVKNDDGSIFAFKTIFTDEDYIGEEIPSGYINITGLISNDASGVFITARSLADLTNSILPPNNLTANATGHDVTLQWEAPASPTRNTISYNVYRDNSLVTEEPIPALIFNENIASFGNYAYTVTAVYPEGESITSNTAAAFIARLNPPQTLTSEFSGQSIELNWLAPLEEEYLGTFQHYFLYCNDNLIVTPVAITATTFTDENIQLGVSYTYFVTAQYTQGESIPSNTTDPIIPVLNPPQDLVAEKQGLTVSLIWQTPSSENNIGTFQYYKVYRNGIVVSSPGDVVSATYIDSDVEIGNTYAYYVTAKYNEGESDPSNTEEVFVARLNPPQDLTTVISNGTIQLNWSAPLEENGMGTFQHYNIYRNEALVITPNEVTTTTFTDDDIQIGEEYTYSVSAQYVQGESAISNVTQPIIPQLNPPHSLVVEKIGLTVELNWQAPATVNNIGIFEHYNIYRNDTLIISDNVITTTTFIDDDIQLGGSYIYAVTAQYTQAESEPTNAEEVFFARLNPPQELSAVINEDSVLLTWIAPLEEEGGGTFEHYHIYRNETLIISDNVVTTFTDGDVQMGGLYTYTVTAKYSEGESEHSNTAEAFFAILNPPRYLEAILEGDVISLSWIVPIAEDGLGTFQYYRVYRNGNLIPTEEFMTTFYTDSDIEIGIDSTYTYFVTAQYLQGESIPSNTAVIRPSSGSEETLGNCKTELLNNYPNPFNPSTVISFSLEREQQVELAIYNLKGQRVKNIVNSVMGVGLHRVVWNGLDDSGKVVSSGIYFYQMKTQDYIKMKKMLLVK